jgi:hypothetical protein
LAAVGDLNSYSESDFGRRVGIWNSLGVVLASSGTVTIQNELEPPNCLLLLHDFYVLLSSPLQMRPPELL